MAITDCVYHCDQNPGINNCLEDCLACQTATNDYLLYDCHSSGHRKCQGIEFPPRCEVPPPPNVTEGFSNMEEDDYQIQVLVTVSIILLFLLYVII